MKNPDSPKPSMQEFFESSYLSGANAAYIEELFDTYLTNPNDVSKEWRDYFDSVPKAQGEMPMDPVREKFKALAQQTTVAAAIEASPLQQKVDNLISDYRILGHLHAKFDPLGKERRQDRRLSLAHHGLSDANLSDTFLTNGVLPQSTASLKDILAQLQKVYCGAIGVEFAYVLDADEHAWLQNYTEHQLFAHDFSAEEKKDLLWRISMSEGWEHYLAKKYVGQKRFSIEGSESLIPSMDLLIENASKHSVKEVVIGMAHRGRINVQVNVMGRPPKVLFDEFDGNHTDTETTGDVKYHLGYSSDIKTEHGSMHLSLAFNPSHLSYISPVVMGSVRARQDMHSDSDHDYAMAIMVHGDAAFSGLGVEMETLAMSQVRSNYIGGSIHITINNQIGFTTDNIKDCRSSRYATGLMKMIEAPVIHVNGDDPEAVVRASAFALEYRMRFHKDVMIDLMSYRRYGHNEADEPSATNPLKYKNIRAHKTTRELYAEALVEQGVITADDAQAMVQKYRAMLDQGDAVLALEEDGLDKQRSKVWKPFFDQSVVKHDADTKYPLKKLTDLAMQISQVPEGFVLQRQVGNMLAHRRKMAEGNMPLDWGMAENLAYATLLEQKFPMRFSGEDVRRGTFSHRHAFLFENNTGEEYSPLQHLKGVDTPAYIYDSILSETGVLGFEYGYSTYEPNALVVWEAQFGDFANGAQVIIDQFISSAWQKWRRISGLVMLLPHGYEGMGPEHSSARLERYLQLAAQDNMQICVPSLPSQMFHLLRRQMVRDARVPLIIFTPKSMLRHKLATSSLEDLATGSFETVIAEIDQIDAKKVKRVILCAGKVYYDLLEKRREQEINDVAIIRLEQLYPFPYDALRAALAPYKNAKDVVWCQEEPKNQGSWFTLNSRLSSCLTDQQTLSYAGRKPMASPASGYAGQFKHTQKQLVLEALDLPVK